MPIRVKVPDGRVIQFPDGTSPDAMKAALLKLPAAQPVQSGGSSTAAPAAPAPSGPTDPRARLGAAALDFIPQAGEALLNATPAALATLGGVGGATVAAPTAPFTAGVGPVAAGLAGAYTGGHLGQNLVDAVHTAQGRGPSSGLEAAKAANQQGQNQAALYGLGEGVLGPITTGAGKALMRIAAKDAGPEVAATMLENGIAATTKGFKRLESRIGAIADRTTQLVKWETKRGLKYDGKTFARELFADLGLEVDKMPIGDPIRKRLYRLTKQFLKENGGLVTPEQLHILKKKSDEIAKPIFEALENKQRVPISEQTWAQWHKAFADKARFYLNETVGKSPGSTEPGAYELANRANEQLIRVKQAIWPEVKKNRGVVTALGHAAANRATGATIGGAMGAAYSPDRAKGALAGAAAGALMGTPAALSSTAVALNSPMIQMILRRGPQGLGVLDALTRPTARDSLQ